MHPSIEKEEESSVIDWHDFTVVVTIDFADDEDYGLFPPMEEQEIKELIGMDEEGLEYAQSVVRAALRIARVLTSVNKMSQQTNIGQDDEIAKNIIHLARTRPDMFGATKEQVVNVVKAEVEKKQVIWAGRTHTRSIMSEKAAALPPRHAVPSVRPLAPPPRQGINTMVTSPSMPMKRFGQTTTSTTDRDDFVVVETIGYADDELLPPMDEEEIVEEMGMDEEEVQYVQAVVRAAMGIAGGGLIPVKEKEIKFAMNALVGLAWLRPDIFGTSKAEVLNALDIEVFWDGRIGNLEDQIDGVTDGTNLSGPHPVPLVKPLPPPPRLALDRLVQLYPEEPEPKKQRLDDYLLVPEDQLLVQHPGPAHVPTSMRNADEAKLKGQVTAIPIVTFK